MGDERRPEATEPATATTSSTVSVRSPPAEGMIGGDDAGKAETAGGGSAAGPGPIEDSGRVRVGAEANAAEEASGATDESGSTDAAEVQGPLTLHDIEGHVLRAIRYHEARARFLDLCRRWLDFSVVLLGAGAITTATNGDKTTAGVVVGILLAGIGALQLVAGFSEKANDHTSLKRRFCGVLAEIVEARGEPPSERRLAKITKKWTAIWSDEPPTLHVLEAIAWNAARRSREYDLDEATLIEIPWWESWTRNLSSWESFEPLTRAERAARVNKASDGLRWWQRPGA